MVCVTPQTAEAPVPKPEPHWFRVGLLCTGEPGRIAAAHAPLFARDLGKSVYGPIGYSRHEAGSFRFSERIGVEAVGDRARWLGRV